MTLRSGLRNNRKNELGAAVVSGIGSFLQNYVKSTQDRQQMDLANKQQTLMGQKAEEDKRANQAMEEWRAKQQILDEKKFDAESGKDTKAAQKSADNYTTKMLMFNEMDLTPEELKETRARLKNVGVLGKVEDQNKVVDEVIKKHYTPEKTAKETGGKTYGESVSMVKEQQAQFLDPIDKKIGLLDTKIATLEATIASDVNAGKVPELEKLIKKYENEQKTLEDQKKAFIKGHQLKQSVDSAKSDLGSFAPDFQPRGGSTPDFGAVGTGTATVFDRVSKLRQGTNSSPVSGDAFMTPRMKDARAKIQAGFDSGQPTVPATMSSQGTPVVAPAINQSQVEPVYGGQDETNAKAIGLLQRMQTGGETIDSVIADFKANQAAYEANGITEQMIYDVFGKAQ